MSGYLGDLSLTQEKSLNEFIELLSKETQADERTLLRFLRARGFDVQAAYKQYLSTVEWRKKNGIDSILDKPRPLDKEFREVMSCGFHKQDKEGRPCYIEYTGRTDVSALVKLPVDQVIRRHIWNCEYQIARMAELSQNSDTVVETMVHIHDMTGASIVLRKALNIFKRLAKLDQDHYPERMGKIFIVNTPWVFPVLWKIARVFLDPKTRSKCVVLKSSENPKLLNYFYAADLPEEFGGCCRCEDGCLPPIPKHMRNIAEAPTLREQSIGPKKSFEKSEECKNDGDSIAWYFKTSSKEIKFGIKFKPRPHSGWKDRMNDIPEVWVEDLNFVTDFEGPTTGFYSPPCPGMCTLVWDNNDSKWLSKTIKYHVMVTEAEVDSDDEKSQSNGTLHKRTGGAKD
ncbi:SEC14 cytosolic factor [Nematostella vectensis]|uniref:SEC14 cytosolic factor n=1 Tax=Nematostella vectensis TaxID=45351 RepID=UPI0020777FAA|nr:SEC14 cytosolic factor [Nematostella vectensis]